MKVETGAVRRGTAGWGRCRSYGAGRIRLAVGLQICRTYGAGKGKGRGLGPSEADCELTCHTRHGTYKSAEEGRAILEGENGGVRMEQGGRRSVAPGFFDNLKTGRVNSVK